MRAPPFQAASEASRSSPARPRAGLDTRRRTRSASAPPSPARVAAARACARAPPPPPARTRSRPAAHVWNRGHRPGTGTPTASRPDAPRREETPVPAAPSWHLLESTTRKGCQADDLAALLPTRDAQEIAPIASLAGRAAEHLAHSGLGMDGLTELASPGIRGGHDGAAGGAQEEADAGMLSLLDDLVGEWAAEKEAHDALGRSERAPGILEPDPRAGSGTRGRRARRPARRLDEARRQARDRC
jgi:hypothetical protein